VRKVQLLNLAIDFFEGEFLLFLDDNIRIPSPYYLATHLKYLKEYYITKGMVKYYEYDEINDKIGRFLNIIEGTSKHTETCINLDIKKSITIDIKKFDPIYNRKISLYEQPIYYIPEETASVLHIGKFFQFEENERNQKLVEKNQKIFKEK